MVRFSKVFIGGILENNNSNNKVIMNKEYQYQKFIRWGQYLIPIFYAILIIGLWLTFLVDLVLEKGGWLSFYSYIFWLPFGLLFPLIAPLIFISILLFLSGLFLWFLYWHMAGIRIYLDREGIFYKSRWEEKRISFNSISSLKFSSISYLGGWMTIISKEGKKNSDNCCS
jgi:hypothetical protein